MVTVLIKKVCVPGNFEEWVLFSPSGTKLFAAAPRSLLFDKAAHFFRFAPFLSESVCVCVGVNRRRRWVGCVILQRHCRLHI